MKSDWNLSCYFEYIENHLSNQNRPYSKLNKYSLMSSELVYRVTVTFTIPEQLDFSNFVQNFDKDLTTIPATVQIWFPVTFS